MVEQFLHAADNRNYSIVTRLSFSLPFPPSLPPSSLANFVLVIYANDLVGLHRTQNCNYNLAGCENVFRARATTFATTTVLLLIHAYNCKNLGASLWTMNVSLEGKGRGRAISVDAHEGMHTHLMTRTPAPQPSSPRIASSSARSSWVA
jgi:hypothetical protein